MSDASTPGRLDNDMTNEAISGEDAVGTQDQLDLVVMMDSRGAAALDKPENEPISDVRSAMATESVSNEGESLIDEGSLLRPPSHRHSASLKRSVQ